VSQPLPVRAVVFDYAGVLGTAPFANTAAFERAMGYPEHGINRLLFGDYVSPRDEDRADDGARGAVHDWHLLEVGELDLATFMARAIERSPEYLAGATFDPVAYGQFLRAAPFGVHWMVVARARELRAAGLRTAILTNNVKEWGSAWRAGLPLEIFDEIVDSSEVGLRKPDAAIFHLTCERLGVDPPAVVFLDDNERNCAGARAVGMEAVLVGEDPWIALDELDALLERRGTTTPVSEG